MSVEHKPNAQAVESAETDLRTVYHLGIALCDISTHPETPIDHETILRLAELICAKVRSAHRVMNRELLGSEYAPLSDGERFQQRLNKVA
jgi:hypothetical protein